MLNVIKMEMNFDNESLDLTCWNTETKTKDVIHIVYEDHDKYRFEREYYGEALIGVTDEFKPVVLDYLFCWITDYKGE